jgi:hypothetical protein
MRRDAVEQFLREITVRIDQPDAVPRDEMLHDEIAKQSRLSPRRKSTRVRLTIMERA